MTKSKRKTGVDARGGHQKDKCKSKEKIVMKKETLGESQIREVVKPENKPNYKSRSNKRNR